MVYKSVRNLFLFSLIVVFLSACITDTSIKVRNPERAAKINAELGLGYMKQGQYKRAMTKLDKALGYDSENIKALHYKGELHRRLDQPEKAEEYFNKALKLAPEDQMLLNNYGVYLCDIKKYDQAISIFTKTLNDPLFEFKASVYENVGLCRLWQGKMHQAERAFHQALAINPKRSQSLLELAKIQFDIGKEGAAYDFYRRYLSTASHTPESLWLGILLEHGRGEKNIVASYKIKLKGRFPDSKQTKLLKKLELQGTL